MILSSAIDYLSMEGFPWVLGAWAGLYAFRPFATLVHELGHFWNCFPANPKPQLLSVGKMGKNFLYEGKRVRFSFSFRNGQEAARRPFPRKTISPFARIHHLVRRSLFFAWHELPDRMVDLELGSSRLARDFWSQLVLRKSLAFIRAVLPMRLRPTEEFPDGPPVTDCNSFG